jgi:hypothetical protein
MDGPAPFGLPLPCVGYGGSSAEVIIEYCKIASCFKVNWPSGASVAFAPPSSLTKRLRHEHFIAFHGQ